MIIALQANLLQKAWMTLRGGQTSRLAALNTAYQMDFECSANKHE